LISNIIFAVCSAIDFLSVVDEEKVAMSSPVQSEQLCAPDRC
jgi:hypothetical protein